METFPTPLSSPLPPAALNGNGHSQRDGHYPASSAVPIPVDPSASLLSAWQLNAQKEEESDLRNLVLIIRRRAWVIAGVAAVTMALFAGNTIRQKEIFQGQFRV
ncbi:MAG: hypothetical protein AAFN12_20050, partial [Cyanobacteria bacterium J06560_2]